MLRRSNEGFATKEKEEKTHPPIVIKTFSERHAIVSIENQIIFIRMKSISSQSVNPFVRFTYPIIMGKQCLNKPRYLHYLKKVNVCYLMKERKRIQTKKK